MYGVWCEPGVWCMVERPGTQVSCHVRSPVSLNAPNHVILVLQYHSKFTMYGIPFQNPHAYCPPHTSPECTVHWGWDRSRLCLVYTQSKSWIVCLIKSNQVLLHLVPKNATDCLKPFVCLLNPCSNYCAHVLDNW